MMFGQQCPMFQAMLMAGPGSAHSSNSANAASRSRRKARKYTR